MLCTLTCSVWTEEAPLRQRTGSPFCFDAEAALLTNTLLARKWFLSVSMVMGCGLSPSFPRALKPQCSGDGGCWDTWLCTCSVCRDTMSRSLNVCACPAMMRPSCTSAEQMCKHVTAEMGGGWWGSGVDTPAKGFSYKNL